jgi:hypothetical protein
LGFLATLVFIIFSSTFSIIFGHLVRTDLLVLTSAAMRAPHLECYWPDFCQVWDTLASSFWRDWAVYTSAAAYPRSPKLEHVSLPGLPQWVGCKICGLSLPRMVNCASQGLWLNDPHKVYG